MEETIKLDIRKLSNEELDLFLEENGIKAFRRKQLMEWLWKKSAASFDEMTNLSKDLRHLLKENFVFRGLREGTVQKSSDGTVKTAFVLHDGATIESVLIPVVDKKRFTVCVSCQVGCSLNCSFCATGKMERVRNLEPSEIYDQVVLVNQQCLEMYGHGLTNIVFMGMGEPLLAYKNVKESIHRITIC